MPPTPRLPVHLDEHQGTLSRMRKSPSPDQGRRGLRGTTLLARSFDRAARARANGRDPPPASRQGSPVGPVPFLRDGRRVQPRRFAGAAASWLQHARAAPGWRSPGAPGRVSTLPGSLADGLLLLPWPAIQLSGGPSGIRTHDLLNAIETRSQLRYGPLVPSCGPGGIRTRDLFSAIEARSQLRYRPRPGLKIVTEGLGAVKQRPLAAPFLPLVPNRHCPGLGPRL